MSVHKIGPFGSQTIPRLRRTLSFAPPGYPGFAFIEDSMLLIGLLRSGSEQLLHKITLSSPFSYPAFAGLSNGPAPFAGTNLLHPAFIRVCLRFQSVSVAFVVKPEFPSFSFASFAVKALLCFSSSDPPANFLENLKCRPRLSDG
jgi:hypothetical protein